MDGTKGVSGRKYGDCAARVTVVRTTRRKGHADMRIIAIRIRVEKCGRIHVLPTHPDELVKGHMPRPQALIANATGVNVDHL